MAKRRYETEELTVLWDSQRCIHTAICLNALPQVFDTRARPWIRPGNASTEEIVHAVERCPTGALRYERKDGPQEIGAEPTTVLPIPNGPLVMRGRLRVLAADGTTVTEEARLTLCRCGASGNQPFCDNTHRRVGFASTPPAPRPERAGAASPAEVCPPQPEVFRR